MEASDSGFHREWLPLVTQDRLELARLKCEVTNDLGHVQKLPEQTSD